MIWAMVPRHREQDFRVQDLATLLDTKPRRIEGWVEQGFIKPAHRGRGPGRPSRFSLENLATAYVLTELQRIHGDRSPVLNRLMASEHTASYAKILVDWLAPAFWDPNQAVEGSPALPKLVLVQDANRKVEGRVLRTGDEKPILLYLKQYLSQCVAITLLTPNQRFREMKERLAASN